MQYQELLDKLNAYSFVLSVVYFDTQTVAPKDGQIHRNKMLSVIEKEYITLLTSDETYQILLENEKSDDLVVKESCRLLLKSFRQVNKIPQNEYLAFNNLRRQSFSAWEKSRSMGDYASYEAIQLELFETHKKIVSYYNDKDTLYEMCLDRYEEGLNESQVVNFFNAIAEQITPLLNQIIDHQAPKPEFLSQNVSVEQQRRISSLIMNHLGYSLDFGYLGETAHPFSSTFSKGDTRITTHYYEDNFISSIFSIIHEVGHSMYNHQVDDIYEETPISHSMSMSLHESQSRMLENMIGRSKEFWIPLYPRLQALIPDVLGDVSLDTFILGINYVEKGQIRTEADEITYPLHVLVRTEFELEVMQEGAKLENLNQKYNQIFEKYFGYQPENDSVGILQDVHWSEAMIGYFPTYALGTAYGAQFMHAMRKDLDVDSLLVEGKLDVIFSWLQKNIHRHGGMIQTQDLIFKVTKERFNPQYYIDYLVDKYSNLHNLNIKS